ncbi:hypothetical protein ACWEDZ_04365 [Streptomyces sp. NPDC005047]
MATRFWLTSSAAPYTPATKRGTWTDATATVTGLLGRQPAGTSATSAKAETSATTTNVLLGRWVSPPARAAGTLSGTVAWMAGRAQSDANAAMVVRAHMYVTVGDSDTVRGTLLTNYTGGTSFPTTAAGGGTAPSTAIASVAVQTGDRIVVEFGYQAQNAVATSYTGTMYYGATGTTDLVAGSTAVTANPGWVEFSTADGLFGVPTAEIVDKFTTGISSRFVYWGGTFWNADWRRVSVQANDQFAGLMANTGYEITGSSHYGEIVKMPTGGVNTTFSSLILGPVDNGTYVRFKYVVPTGLLIFENAVGYFESNPPSVAYSPVAHRWLRFREAAGTFYWETSPDAATWTVRRSITTPQWLKFGTLRTNFEGYADSGSTAAAAEVDNINTIPTTVVKVWNGSEWAAKPLKVWNGTAWVAKPVKSWSETAWF